MSARDVVTDIGTNMNQGLGRILKEAFEDGFDNDILVAYGNKLKLEDSAGSYKEIYVDDVTLTIPATASETTGDGVTDYYGDGSDVGLQFDGTDMLVIAGTDDLKIKWGDGTKSFDQYFYGNTASDTVVFDASGNTLTLDGVDLYLNDSDILCFGDAQDVQVRWDGTDLDILALADDQVIKIGNGTNSFDVTWYGDAVTNYVSFDAGDAKVYFEDVDLRLGDNDEIELGDGGDVTVRFDGTDLDVLGASDDLIIKIGNGTNSFDVWWYGDAASNYVTFDAGDAKVYFEDVDLHLGDNDEIELGDGTDVTIRWDGTDLDILAAADDQVIKVGNGTNSFDVYLMGNTADDYAWFDASGNCLYLGQDDHGIKAVLYGATAGVNVTWDQANDELDITATVEIQSTYKLQFQDTGTYIYSSADGQLDLVSDGAIYLNGLVTHQDPNTETLAGTKTLVVTDKRIHFLDPDGSGRDVVLPAEASSAGIIFYICNAADGAETLTVKDDATNTILTIAQNEAGIAICDGVSWLGLVGANT